MALTKVTGSGVEGITNLSNATFLSVDASEVATLLTSAVINSEGGAVTHNIAQGLTKSWVNFNGTGTIAARDSFNHSGLTDVSQGNYTVTMASAMGNVNYTCFGGIANTGAGAGPRYAQFGSNFNSGTLDANFTTTAYSVNVFYPNSNDEYDAEHTFNQVCGDLA